MAKFRASVRIIKRSDKSFRRSVNGNSVNRGPTVFYCSRRHSSRFDPSRESINGKLFRARTKYSEYLEFRTIKRMMNGFDSVDVHAFVSVAIVFLITNY